MSSEFEDNIEREPNGPKAEALAKLRRQLVIDIVLTLFNTKRDDVVKDFPTSGRVISSKKGEEEGSKESFHSSKH
ncbi:hypothetical protein PIB30_093634 [Stylosanthes scabra]|uniref:Uncharacterized protein n=1 Tax=Stylosanthes scabra TaxID=79078 RepID=A0ABU6XVH6_9FABA|nr:hypothetical protein [Stylosanthes scabra]